MIVSDIRGRFPAVPVALREAGLRASTRELAGGRFSVWLDSDACPDFWLEFEVFVCGGASEASGMADREDSVAGWTK